jgi:hypothetical protein
MAGRYVWSSYTPAWALPAIRKYCIAIRILDTDTRNNCEADST